MSPVGRWLTEVVVVSAGVLLALLLLMLVGLIFGVIFIGLYEVIGT